MRWLLLFAATAACGDSSSGPDPVVDTGVSCSIFPADNWWNTDVSAASVHPSSDAIVERIGADDLMHPDFGTVWEGDPIGIPFIVVGGETEEVPVAFGYDD